MQVSLFRALRSANVAEDTAEQVVHAIEEHIDMAVTDAMKHYDDRITTMQTVLEAKLDSGLKNIEASIKGFNGQMTGMNGKIDGLKESMDGKIDGLKEGMEGKIDGLKEAMEGKLDGLKEGMEGRFTGIETSIKMLTWAIGIIGALVALGGTIGSWIVGLVKFLH